MRLSSLLLTIALALLPASARADGWKFDVLRLKNGRSIQGLLVEESPVGLRFQYVQQRPGERTIVIFTTFQPNEVARIDRLDDGERALLKKRLQQLDPKGEGERRQIESLELKTAPWNGNLRAGRSYPAEHFRLLSNAREEIVREAAFRLEQIYAAYARFLPPRRQSAQPTTILLVETQAEYQELLQKQGRNIFNPAFYDPAVNQVVCLCYLRELGERLAFAALANQQARENLAKHEVQVRQLYKSAELAGKLAEITKLRQQLAQADKNNEDKYRAAERRLFQILYHEAFHAYLANFVYPPAESHVPRWLNEGLAQIFETAIIEAGELRVGHAPSSRLEPAQKALKAKKLVPLTDLLVSGPKQFLLGHGSDAEVADNHYLTSWAVSFYLTFDRRLLGTAELDRYVTALHRGTEPKVAFHELTGMPLPQFEEAFQQYLQKLR